MRADRRTLLALFSIAFGLRILFAALIGAQSDADPYPITPSVEYAQEIASGLNWMKEPFSKWLKLLVANSIELRILMD